MRTINTTEVRSFWESIYPLRWSVGLIVVLNSFLLIWLLIQPVSKHFYVTVETSIIAAGPLLLLPWCLSGLWRHRGAVFVAAGGSSGTRLLRWMPILLGLAILSQSLGESLFVYYYTHNQAPFPSLEDMGYLSAYPFLLLTMLLFTRHVLPVVARLRILLDGLIVMVAALTFSWFFLLGPNALMGGKTLLTPIVAAAYPMGDIVLIFCLLLLAISSHERVLRPVFVMLTLGLLSNVIADSFYGIHELLSPSSAIGAVTDAGWLCGYMLYGLAGQAVWKVMARQSSAGNTLGCTRESIAMPPSRWLSLVPYALVPAVVVFYVYTDQDSVQSLLLSPALNTVLKKGVVVGTAVMIGLILLRQFFAVRETVTANRALRRAQKQMHAKNQALGEANKLLEAQAAQIEVAFEQQRQLNELKDQFLLNVNHELRTPLTEMRGYLDLLQEYNQHLDPELLGTFINRAAHGCDELQQMVGKVLEAIRGGVQEQAAHIEDIAVSQVVHNVIQIFEPQKLQDHSVDVEVDTMLVARADQQFLYQVLLNLLSNAFKYAPPHTSVQVSATLLVGCPVKKTSDQVRICVQDAGPGIPPSEIPLLFGKFVRLKRDLVGPVRGTGLGLYISKQMVEAMGGDIWVESSGRPGEGSRFCLTLPAACSSTQEHVAPSSDEAVEATLAVARQNEEESMQGGPGYTR